MIRVEAAARGYLELLAFAYKQLCPNPSARAKLLKEFKVQTLDAHAQQ